MMRRFAMTGLLALGLSGARVSFAEEPAGGSPEPASEESSAAEPTAGEPDASVAPPRTWLRQSKARSAEASEEGAERSNPWSILAALVVAGLGGAAVYLKYKRGGANFLLPQSDVRVLSTTRLGGKAQLIVAEVYGRPLLLGVTEQNINELGWIDSLQGEGERPAEAPERPEYASRGRFGDSLAASMNRGDEVREVPFRGNPNVAALIAANAPPDVVQTRRTPRGEGRASARASAQAEASYARVEDQVAGLARRRR